MGGGAQKQQQPTTASKQHALAMSLFGKELEVNMPSRVLRWQLPAVAALAAAWQSALHTEGCGPFLEAI